MTRWTPGNLVDGRKVIAVAGTPERLAGTTTVADRTETTSIIIQAESDNTGTVTVGTSTVIDATATRRGTYLAAGDSVTLSITNLFKVWLDVSASGDGVTYLAESP